MSKRGMAALGWTRTDPRPWDCKTKARWRHDAGYELEHCGHPTARSPWVLYGPPDEGGFRSTYGPFGTLALAADWLEAHLWPVIGSVPLEAKPARRGPPPPVLERVGAYEVPAVFKHAQLQEELVGRVLAIRDGEREERPDYEACDADVELALQDLEDTGELSGRDLLAARRWLVARGVYRAISAEELARSWEMRGGRERPSKADFRLDGQAYVFDRHLREPGADGG